MADYDRDTRRTDTPMDDDTHATTGGAAAAGAVTGGVIGMAAGPVGAAVGAVGGAIVGAITEGVMHAGEDHDYDTVTTSTTRSWADESPHYRERWQTKYGTSGGKYEDYEPYYRHGWEMRNDPRFRGKEWSAIESDVRTDWEGRYKDSPWDEAKDSLRDAWSGSSRGSRR